MSIACYVCFACYVCLYRLTLEATKAAMNWFHIFLEVIGFRWHQYTIKINLQRLEISFKQIICAFIFVWQCSAIIFIIAQGTDNFLVHWLHVLLVKWLNYFNYFLESKVTFPNYNNQKQSNKKKILPYMTVKSRKPLHLRNQNWRMFAIFLQK